MIVIFKVIMSSVSDIASLNKPDFLKMMMFPIVHNIPADLVKNNSLYPIVTSSCVKWFMFDFDASNASDSSSNMADIVSRVTSDPFREHCSEIDLPVPYFEKHNAADFTAYIKNQIVVANQKMFRPGLDVESRPF